MRNEADTRADLIDPKLVEAGWLLTESDIARDVHLLFGGAFEAFLSK